VEYCFQAFKKMHPDTDYRQECMVPHWVRGEKEKAKLLGSRQGDQELSICALGGSIGTPTWGLQGEVIEINDFEQLKKLKKKDVAGKIVFYNHVFDPTRISTFDGYGEAVEYRWSGPSRASELGAIATICRSCNPGISNFPHTGAMGYDSLFAKIPCCAISTAGAELLSNLLKEEPKLLV
jgi:carboxypeptidase Q